MENRAAAEVISAIFPQTMTLPMWVAIAVGIGLVATGLLSSNHGNALNGATALLISIGVALLAATFGGNGSVQYSGMLFAGCAAIMFGILYAIMPAPNPYPAAIRGTIGNIDYRKFDARLTWDNDVRSMLDHRNGRLKFAMFDEDRSESDAVLVLSDKSGEDRHRIRISPKCLNAYWGKRARTNWEVDANKGQIVDLDYGRHVVGISFNEDGEQQPVDCSAIIVAENSAPAEHKDYFSISAFAGEENALFKRMPLGEEKLHTAFSDLSSDDTAIRRAARETLSEAAPADVPSMLEMLQDAKASGKDPYRTELGVVVALTEMLRKEKSLAEEVAKVLQPEQKQLILEMAGDPDRTKRLYATEFLYDLGDPEAAALALRKAVETNDPTARFNLIFSAQEGWRVMDEPAKKSIEPQLDKLFESTAGLPQTRKLLEYYKQ